MFFVLKSSQEFDEWVSSTNSMTFQGKLLYYLSTVGLITDHYLNMRPFLGSFFEGFTENPCQIPCKPILGVSAGISFQKREKFVQENSLQKDGDHIYGFTEQVSRV